MGALPSNIQPLRRAWTVPRWRCRSPPTVLKIAPCRMSVPIATVGSKPRTMTRMGVISEPPPMPIRPTSVPISRPVSVSCQVTPRWRSRGDLRGDQIQLCKSREHDRGRLARRLSPGIESQLGIARLLVRSRNTGEVVDLARKCGRVESLRVAARALLQRSRDMHLDEWSVLLDEQACVPACFLVGRDG